MAAQDYYQGGSGNLPPAPSSAQAARPPTNPAPLQVPGNPPYPLYDGPPPPYSPGEGRANSQPPPHRRTDSLGETLNEKPQRQASPRIPYEQSQASGRIPYEQSPRPDIPRPEHNIRAEFNPPRPEQPPRPSPADYESQFRPAVRQQHSYAYSEDKRQQYYQAAPPVQPHTNHVGFAGAQFYPPRERSRSRSRSRDRKKHHQRKKSSGINTFLGAGGGALIGDAIFPGLGTLGGAILGGMTGHEYGKSKSKDARHRERRYSDEYEYRPSRRN